MRRGQRVVVSCAIAATAAVYLLRLDPAAGLFKDDGWYIVMAKALATGHGLTLINFPVEGGVYFYPPVFPILLASVFAIHPSFPENVWLLKAISIAAMAATGWFTYRLSVRHGGVPPNLAALIAFAVVLAPSWVFLATSTVMSECVFVALLTATLAVAERRLAEGLTFKWTLILAGLATLAWLTRSAGIALVVALGLYLGARRNFRQAAVFVIASMALASPWWLYQRHAQAKAPQELQAQLPQGYRTQFWQRAAGTDSQAEAGAGDLLLRVGQNTAAIAGADSGALLLPSVFRTPAESGEEVIDLTTEVFVPRDYIGWGKGTMGNALGTKLLSLLGTIAITIGWAREVNRKRGLPELFTVVFLGTVVIWPGPTFRYLLPVTPLLLYYFVVGAKEMFSSLEPEADFWGFARTAILCVLAFYAYDHYGYLAARRQPVTEPGHPEWLRKFEASRAAGAWIREHTPPEEVISGDNLPMAYLYSGRLTAKCAPRSCRAMGVRVYLRQQDIYDFPAGEIRYQSPIYNQVKVAVMAGDSPGLPKD